MLNKFAPVEAQWQVDGDRYQISLNIGMLGKIRSEGAIDERGLRPTLFQRFKVNEQQAFRQIDFDWAAKQARVGEPGKQRDFPLKDGAVDVFSAG
jgi:hypothetical protein